MTTQTATTTTETTAIINSPFVQELVRQVRSEDTYGVYRNWADELVVKPFVLTKEAKRNISIEGSVEPLTQARIRLFYRAIAARIEQETGKLAQVIIDLSHEGFGWGLVFCGRLIVVAKTLRDAHRFGFDSLEKLEAQGEKLVQSGVKLIQDHPDVAKL